MQSLYSALTIRAISAYEACVKTNSIIRLRADLAALALYTEDWQGAFNHCKGLARDCAEMGVWEPVAKFALEGALRSHKELRLHKDEEWVNIALAYVRVCIISGTSGDAPEQLSDTIEGLRGSDLHRTGEYSLSSRYRRRLIPTIVEEHKAFNLRMSGDPAATEEDTSLTAMTVTVQNLLPVVSAIFALAGFV
jgi:hypothetical protein